VTYVGAAYALTVAIVAAYALSIRWRRREVERSLRAWRELAAPSRGPVQDEETET